MRLALSGCVGQSFLELDEDEMDGEGPRILIPVQNGNDVGRGRGARVLEVAAVHDVPEKPSTLRGMHRAGRRYVGKPGAVVGGRAETQVAPDGGEEIRRVGNLAVAHIAVAGDDAVSLLHRGAVQEEG